MSIPLIKLGYLLIRTLSKPIANSIKKQAVNKPSFRETCIKLAQSYHKMEVHLRRRLKNGSGPKLNAAEAEEFVVRPLDEKKAIELGANFIGEFVIFSVAGIVLTMEAIRTREIEKNRREDVKDRLEALESQVAALKAELDKRN